LAHRALSDTMSSMQRDSRPHRSEASTGSLPLKRGLWDSRRLAAWGPGAHAAATGGRDWRC
jgi:hypothetical protein